MSEGERRREHREPLPIGVYLIVDGVRHPGTLRDLSMSGAGFSDPVLAVRLNLHQAQTVVLEIPPDSPGPPPLRVPGEVAHVSSGLRPRLGIRFEALDPEILRSINERMGRKAPAAPEASHTGDLKPAMRRGSVDPDLEDKRAQAESREFRFVLIEPTKRERGNSTMIWALIIGALVVGAFFGLIWALSNLEL
jgi:hypothetical protein